MSTIADPATTIHTKLTLDERDRLNASIYRVRGLVAVVASVQRSEDNDAQAGLGDLCEIAIEELNKIDDVFKDADARVLPADRGER